MRVASLSACNSWGPTFNIDYPCPQEETPPAIFRMIAKIDGKRGAKIVYRLHGDRAQELTGKIVQDKNDRGGNSSDVDGSL